MSRACESPSSSPRRVRPPANKHPFDAAQGPPASISEAPSSKPNLPMQCTLLTSSSYLLASIKEGRGTKVLWLRSAVLIK